MAHRTPLRLLAISLLLAAPASADALFVAGPDGVVLRADSQAGQFEPFTCACSAPVLALDADDSRLFAVDAAGELHTFDLATGTLVHSVPLRPVGVTSVAVAGTSVFVGTEGGLVLQVDPATGLGFDARSAPAGVRDLLAHDGSLFATGADGAIYRASVASGDFTYFSCFCFFDLQDIGFDGELLVVGDSFGGVVRIDPATGELLSFASVSGLNSLAPLDGDVLFHAGGGEIRRVDPETGVLASPDSYYLSPLDVSAMLVVEDRPVSRNHKGFDAPLQLPSEL